MTGFEVQREMNEVSPLKHGIIDLAAIFFMIGGVVSLVVSILTIPIATIYPFVLPTVFTMVFGCVWDYACLFDRCDTLLHFGCQEDVV